MFIDASALTAILVEERDAAELLAKLEEDPVRHTSPLAIWETVIAVARALGLEIEEATRAVEQFLELAAIKVTPVPPQTARMALQAFDRFGKGRHPARLNFGDCFAYACARNLGDRLLFKGDDFPLTDIESA